MFVAVADSGEALWAVSEWRDRKETKFRTLYQDHLITRYVQEGEGWTPLNEIVWTRVDGRPLGIPIAHFPNGAAPFGVYARSTVASVLNAQDALNASLFNRQAVVALTGTKIYTATGVPNDQRMEVAAGALWTATDPSADFGALEPGDISGLMLETNDLRNVISKEFPVPAYRIGQGDWPSGLALQRADSPMIAQIQLLEEVSTPGYLLLAHRATELYNTFSNQPMIDENAVIGLKWKPSDEVDPGTKVEIDLKNAELLLQIEKMTKTMMTKIGVLETKEIEALVKELDARMELVAAANADDETEFGSSGGDNDS